MTVSEPLALKYHAGRFKTDEMRTQCGRSSARAAASCGRSFYARSRRWPLYWSAFGHCKAAASSRVICRRRCGTGSRPTSSARSWWSRLEQNSPLGKLLAIGLANRNKPRALMVERLEDGGRHVVHELERFLNTLGTIAAVAPLLGLLGHRRGNHPCVQRHHRQRPRRSADPVRRHRRGADHDRRGAHGGDPVADRVPLSARQGRASGDSHGKGGDEAGRCTGRARPARRRAARDAPHEPASAQSGRPRDQCDQLHRRPARAADFLHGVDHLPAGGARQGAATAGERDSAAARVP